jgi:hypothetical protein
MLERLTSSDASSVQTIRRKRRPFLFVALCSARLKPHRQLTGDEVVAARRAINLLGITTAEAEPRRWPGTSGQVLPRPDDRRRARSWQKCSSGGELSTFCSLPSAAARDRGAHRKPWTYRPGPSWYDGAQDRHLPVAVLRQISIGNRYECRGRHPQRRCPCWVRPNRRLHRCPSTGLVLLHELTSCTLRRRARTACIRVAAPSRSPSPALPPGRLLT